MADCSGVRKVGSNIVAFDAGGRVRVLGSVSFSMLADVVVFCGGDLSRFSHVVRSSCNLRDLLAHVIVPWMMAGKAHRLICSSRS